MDITELDEAVDAIQQDIYESTGGVEYFDLLLYTNGIVQKVSFCGIELWCSEDDDRQHTDEYDEVTIEPIEQWLRRMLTEELQKLSTIKV